MNMLQEIILEKDLAWDKYMGNIVENFFVKISDNVTNELKNNSNLINYITYLYQVSSLKCNVTFFNHDVHIKRHTYINNCLRRLK